jgi:hypothetical protein
MLRQQTLSPTNESELCCSNQCHHILQTSSRSITACSLTLPPDCLLSRMLACISIIMVFSTIIVTQRVQYRLSVPHVAKENSPEKPTAKPTKTIFYRTRRKVRQKKKNLYKSTLPTMQITMLPTSKDKNQSPSSFSVDTDGVYFTNPCSLEILKIKKLL